MRKVKFNDEVNMEGTGWHHGFFSTPWGILAVTEIEQAGETTEGPPIPKGQIVTCDCKGITFLKDEVEYNTHAKCVCGHMRSQHIYHEGACRPGFQCEIGCDRFVNEKE